MTACGIVVLDKPAGWTSQDAAARLRRVFDTRRVGHGGTLDPMATGVLPIFVGRATRAASFFQAADKEYHCALRLGLETDTQDITGTVLAQRPAEVSDEALLAALSRFLGPQQQLPPMYSAIKVNGQKLYELARKGREVERQPRDITITRLDYLGRDEAGDVLLRVACSKGTYIRTLCADLGRALGCGGCMSRLRRTRAGRYTLAEAHTMDQLIAAGEAGRAGALLLGVDTLFDQAPALTLTQPETVLCRNGNPIPRPDAPEGQLRVYGPEGDFLMLGRGQNGAVYTVKSFFEVK